MDEAEAERLVDTYSDMILRLSYTYLKNTDDAEDICQEVFLKMLAGKVIGDSVVSGNIRMTADAVIGDGRHVAVVYTLEKTDGTDFDEEMFYNESDDELQVFFRDEDWDLDADFTDSVIVGGTSYFLKIKGGKNSIQFVDTADADQNVIGGRFRRTFKDIGIFEEEIGEVKILERGRWRANFS